MDNTLFIEKKNITVSQAMQAINVNSKGIVFLVDEADRLVACISDGDIRRYILDGGQISDNVMLSANKAPQYAKNIEDAKKYEDKKLPIIPIVDEDLKIIDFYFGDEPQKRLIRNALNIPVVINAGGRGTRLDPFTKVLPKPLIPVGEVPIIELIMQEYQLYSCNNFHIIVNYKKDLMKAYFHDSDMQYNITWYDEEEPLGTGGGLSLLKGKMNETFFFANCDALLTADYEDMIHFHREHGNAITMICAYKNINIPYGVIEIGDDGMIESMKEKPLISVLTNTGIYICEPEIIDDINDNEAIDFPDIINREKQKGKKVAVFTVSEADWMDMGQLPELERMRVKLYEK